MEQVQDFVATEYRGKTNHRNADPINRYLLAVVIIVGVGALLIAAVSGSVATYKNTVSATIESNRE